MARSVLQVNNHWFYGDSNDFVLIVAGIHSSELGGIEVANWVRVKLLKQKQRPKLGVIVVPEVFPDRARLARIEQWNAGAKGETADSNKYRDIEIGAVSGKQIVSPARQFPPPGQPLSFLKGGPLKDSLGKNILDGSKKPIPLLHEMEDLIRFIELIKPVRIVSIHGKRLRTKADVAKAAKLKIIDQKVADSWDGVTPIKGLNWPGIYVDPRYAPNNKCQAGFEVEKCKFDFQKDPAHPLDSAASVKKVFDSAVTPDGQKDDALTLAVAKAVSDADLVARNHLADQPEVVHYAKEEGTPNGFSLGDWGPVEVKVKDPTQPGARPGAPVLTIEVLHYGESWAFLNGEQMVDENGKAIPQNVDPTSPSPLLPGPPYPKPRLFSQQRSQQLQAYADAIISTVPIL